MMNKHCLICESEAVLTRDASKGLALLVGLLAAALRAGQQASNGHGYDRLLNGLAAVTPALAEALQAAEDVAQRHFAAGFDCLCLRCGAAFARKDEHHSPSG